jgi:hypothetical protein
METTVSKEYLKFAYRVASRICAEQCAAEGYPSHGENYDLRMSGDVWMNYLPAFMRWDRIAE